MKRFRIALVVDHFWPRIGGIETQVSELARQLHLAGHDVTVVTTTPGPSDLDGIPVERIPAVLIPKYQISWTIRPLRRLRQFLSATGFDLVHCHSSVYSPLAYSGLIWCQQLQLPSMLTVHSVVKHTSRIFGELDRYFDWRSWPTVWSTVSHFNAEWMARYARLPTVHVIPNGIHPQRWNIERREHSGLQITSVLRLNRKKRPHDLIRSLPAILRADANTQVRLNVIGDGPLRNSVERLARRLGVQHAVQFHGALDHATIVKIFETTDVLAHPTTTEAFGIAVLEAMAAGLPIVARAGCGISDLVQDGQQGFLASSHDAFAAHIVDLLHNAEWRTRMGASARETALRFRWEPIVAQHMELYEEARRRTNFACAASHS